ncbi:hypothetical protein E1B28_001058 [Marasmius oreades]|uniref:FAD-binding PCMH-type domain-containing protein n=1 Tax=Marasmius oreades TaxID=181124 RepID=A0A9P7V2M2_9AGAR|nr:uncharacterized protein E1B28_001058 [Marasmius oreades]KAG7099189.1 hypothetical protein E1B28_001058 [Marasmius oreades]
MFCAALVVVATFIVLTVGKDSACRLLPTDSSWPAQDVWNAFNQSVDGRLIQTVPLGRPCHDPNYDEAKCSAIRDNWHSMEFHEASSSSIMDPGFLNKSCDPFDPRETPCRVGAYVQYAVNVSSVDHVIKTVQFVKEHNIRFVVRNTGHDFLGRSTGAGAVAVWVHHLRDVEWIPEFKSPLHTGPAFKAHAGALSFDIALAADSKGLVVVTGGTPNVGFTGGFVQGGGQSATMSSYGLGADQTLEFEVVTTQGKFVRASHTENQDLYWALSGGGAGTYAVVWSVTVKAHQDLPVTTASLNFTLDENTQETFYQAIDAYQASTPSLADAKIWSTAQYSSAFFNLFPIFAVNKTSAEISALLQPLLDSLDRLGVKYTSSVQSYDKYLDGYNTLDNLINVPIGVITFGSRLLPQSVFAQGETLRRTQETIRGILEGGGLVADFIMKPTLDVAGNPQNAVLPAWRDVNKHVIVALPLTDGESSAQLSDQKKKITTEFMPALKKLTPGSGSYDNEGDPSEPDFKEAFYGANYDRLLEIKDKWDPDQILYGAVNVGGDRWHQTEEGRLCRNEDSGCF